MRWPHLLIASFALGCGAARHPSKTAPASLAFAEVPVVFGDPVPSFYFDQFAVNPTVETSARPQSSVALDSDVAPFERARALILAGRRPAPGSVRTEAFINFAAGLTPPPPPLGPAAGPLVVSAQRFPSPTRPGYDLLHLTVSARAGPATDVLATVQFDPEAVLAYRLFGYERARSATRVGGHIAAGRSATVLYEVKLRDASRLMGQLSLEARSAEGRLHRARFQLPAGPGEFGLRGRLIVLAAVLAERLRGGYWTRHLSPEAIADLRASVDAPTSPVVELARALARDPPLTQPRPADFDRVPIVAR